MRRKFIEKTSYFDLLKELSGLPDNITSQPYYFKQSTKIDMFVTFTRHEVVETQQNIFDTHIDTNFFTLDFCCTHAGTNRSKLTTFAMYHFNLHYDYFTMPILKYNFANIVQFFHYVANVNEKFKDIYTKVSDYLTELEVSNEFTLI